MGRVEAREAEALSEAWRLSSEWRTRLEAQSSTAFPIGGDAAFSWKQSRSVISGKWKAQLTQNAQQSVVLTFVATTRSASKFEGVGQCVKSLLESLRCTTSFFA